MTFPRNKTYVPSELWPAFKFYSVFPIMFIRMETFLVLVSDFSVQEMAPLLRSEQ